MFVLSSVPALLIAGEITTECQSQAKEYSVQPELVSQYVKDCVVSMGGEAPTPAQALGGADSSERASDAGGVSGDLEAAQSGAIVDQ